MYRWRCVCQPHRPWTFPRSVWLPGEPCCVWNHSRTAATGWLSSSIGGAFSDGEPLAKSFELRNESVTSMAGVCSMALSESTNKAARGLPWFAIEVKTTHEKRVTSLLDYQAYEWFLPLYRCRRRWSDRIKEVELPLFPGYVFCRFAPCSRVPILKTPSVMRIVGIGGTPTPIDDDEISAIHC